jgi:hypothetical protein
MKYAHGFEDVKNPYKLSGCQCCDSHGVHKVWFISLQSLG